MKAPAEPLKTLLAALFLATGFVATTTSLAITHESVPEIEPLPDVILDHLSYQEWGLFALEILIIIQTITVCLVSQVDNSAAYLPYTGLSLLLQVDHNVCDGPAPVGQEVHLLNNPKCEKKMIFSLYPQDPEPDPDPDP